MKKLKFIRFVGCKPAPEQVCEKCGKKPGVIHTLATDSRTDVFLPALHMMTERLDVCLECAESLVSRTDKGMPTWAESRSRDGGLGADGWTSRWHAEEWLQ